MDQYGTYAPQSPDLSGLGGFEEQPAFNTYYPPPAPYAYQPAMSRKPKPEPAPVEEKAAPGVLEGIEVRTKFPVARIKRIMQADEDVGKVAQVTPTAVSKALELFMIELVTQAADKAESKSSRRVTAQHLKEALHGNETFDFLDDIMAKVPDAPSSKKKDDTEESDEGEGKKKKKARRRRKDEED